MPSHPPRMTGFGRKSIKEVKNIFVGRSDTHENVIHQNHVQSNYDW